MAHRLFLTALLLLSLLGCLSMATMVYAQPDATGTDAATATDGYNGPKEQLHVYLLIGQSNMAGCAPFTKEEAKLLPRCYLLKADDKWELAENPFNRYSTIRAGDGARKMNPGYTFAKAMLDHDETISLGLVSNARGGTSINLWGKGTRFYQEAVRRTKEAQKTGTLKGILWHQGESDATDAKYLEKLKALVEDLRKDLDAPNLPFVAGQINNVKLINDQIAELPSVVPFTDYVRSEDLHAMDRWHFDSPSIRLMGKRYAKAILKLQAEQAAKPK